MDGVLNVLKPAGMTSFDVIAFLRRVYGQKKIGHGGTLDPLAAGVLPVFLGRAARLIEYAPIHTKTYEAEFLMGFETDTEDVTGKITARGEPLTDIGAWERAAENFRGSVMQVPSAYSAKQIGGRRAYDLAREGKEVALPARPVEISRLCIREIDPPYLRLSVTCSSGTYVRALGRDLGRAAGCPLTMSFLLRTEMGPFRISEARTLEEIEAAPEAACGDLRMILSELPQLTLTAEEAAGFLTGKRLRTRAADAEEAAVCGPQGFLGIAAVRGGVIHPKKVFS